MICSKCDAPIPDSSSRCPYCGNSTIVRTTDKDVTAEDFDGIALEPNKVLAQTSANDIDEDSDTKGAMLDLLNNYDPIEADQEQLVNLQDEEDGVRLEFAEPASEQNDAHASSGASGRQTDSYIVDKSELKIKTTSSTDSVYIPPVNSENALIREISTSIKPAKSSNIIVGFMAIFLACYMIFEGSIFLAEWLGFFDPAKYQTFVVKYVETFEAIIMIMVVWFVGAVARPSWLKALSLLFAFTASSIYGLYIYLRYFSGT
jgi:hypothetical protein